MQVSVTFRNTGSESWFKDYATERLSKLQKYIDKPVEAHVVLSVEKFRNVAEINIMAKGINLVGKEEAKDMQLAIDNVHRQDRAPDQETQGKEPGTQVQYEPGRRGGRPSGGAGPFRRGIEAESRRDPQGCPDAHVPGGGHPRNGGNPQPLRHLPGCPLGKHQRHLPPG